MILVFLRHDHWKLYTSIGLHIYYPIATFVISKKADCFVDSSVQSCEWTILIERLQNMDMHVVKNTLKMGAELVLYLHHEAQYHHFPEIGKIAKDWDELVD